MARDNAGSNQPPLSTSFGGTGVGVSGGLGSAGGSDNMGGGAGWANATPPLPNQSTGQHVTMPSVDPGAARRFLDDKVAQSPTFQYKASEAAKWILKVRNYVVGIYPDMTVLLKWAENQQHRVIASAENPSVEG